MCYVLFMSHFMPKILNGSPVTNVKKADVLVHIYNPSIPIARWNVSTRKNTWKLLDQLTSSTEQNGGNNDKLALQGRRRKT